jgi:chorismate mutase
MQGKYLIVDKSLLPSYCEKVAEARELLDEGQARDVSEAVKMVGISRSTYYKYKDMVRDKHSLNGPSCHHLYDDEP